MIREATIKDIKSLTLFLLPFHEKSGYTDIKPNSEVAKKNLEIMLSSRMHKIWVVERDGEICGSLGVVSNELWFTKRHYATNLFFCVNDKGRGTGGYLLRKFKRWIDSRPIIRDVTLAITSEMGDVERVEKLYQAVGFKRLGGLYRYLR